MKSGTLIARHCVVTLKSSSIVVDWGNGSCQDIHTGQFYPIEERDVSHTTLDEELEVLRKSGLVAEFDIHQVQFTTLPDSPKKAID
jgi:predicted DNA-binding protein with PD1-like motif